MIQAYAAVGRAVVATQGFETALAPIFEFYKMHAIPGHLDRTAGYVQEGTFKMPIRAITKALSESGSIAPELENRLNEFAEARHRLVHRWVKENGWPDDDDHEAFQPIISLATHAEREAQALSRIILGDVVRHFCNEGSTIDPDKDKAKVLTMFKQAHSEEDLPTS
jgi:hypothetical protein